MDKLSPAGEKVEDVEEWVFVEEVWAVEARFARKKLNRGGAETQSNPQRIAVGRYSKVIHKAFESVDQQGAVKVYQKPYPLICKPPVTDDLSFTDSS
jgi:hypothetical protein